ncbi:uncharacterized protein LOC117175547 [Belonocnema kinseyi]|uniref:uncharacterized protein LOC117175547 n=1 Tax=Belonocnema kinseyi TaxID=2817044 RepID=UPI00143D24DC|nr:uncharacterized protein LOC117175547 [Belonocnema kinseyi]
MEALNMLLYIYFLLSTCGKLGQTPDERCDTFDHILIMYGLFLEMDQQEKLASQKREFWEMESEDKKKYLLYLRLRNKKCKKLLRKINPYIEKKRCIREPIPAQTRLEICLRYLASEDSMTSISFAFRVSPNTVSKIVRETCRAIWLALRCEAFLRLNTARWYIIAKDFEDKWNFCHCIGAVDGKQVLMQAPPITGSAYYNYKERFGINLMAVADAHYRFIAVDIGAPGRRSDGGVFRESRIKRRFERDALQVPPPNTVDEKGTKLPYVLVVDEAFSSSSFLMRPYSKSGVLNQLGGGYTEPK